MRTVGHVGIVGRIACSVTGKRAPAPAILYVPLYAARVILDVHMKAAIMVVDAMRIN